MIACFNVRFSAMAMATAATILLSACGGGGGHDADIVPFPLPTGGDVVLGNAERPLSKSSPEPIADEAEAVPSADAGATAWVSTRPVSVSGRRANVVATAPP